MTFNDVIITGLLTVAILEPIAALVWSKRYREAKEAEINALRAQITHLEKLTPKHIWEQMEAMQSMMKLHTENLGSQAHQLQQRIEELKKEGDRGQTELAEVRAAYARLSDDHAELKKALENNEFPSLGTFLSSINTSAAASLSAHIPAPKTIEALREYVSKAQAILGAGIRRAIERDEFLLYYQPTLCLRTGEVTGAEVFLRWEHPELGMLPPSAFIPLVEEMGLMLPLGRQIIKAACNQNIKWQQSGITPIRVSVNLSRLQLTDSFVHDVAGICAETGMNPALLDLEFTESMMLEDPSRVIDLLADFKKSGVRLTVDDFGTGYSSLAQIKRLPIDAIKIDRSFIYSLPQDADDMAITGAIISMAKTMALTVIAEGVETGKQLTFLRKHHCDEIQGFYLSKPLPSNMLADFLRNHDASKWAEK